MAVQSGKSIGNMRENLAKVLLAGDYTHIFYMDSDMSYPTHALKHLLKCDKDLINLFSVSRDINHTPIFLPWKEGGQADYNSFRAWPTVSGKRDGQPLSGARRVHVVGGAGLLIKRSVFETLQEQDPEKPFFYSSDNMQEDMYFSIRCDQAGLKMYTVVDIVAGHISSFEALPTHSDDGWIVERKY